MMWMGEVFWVWVLVREVLVYCIGQVSSEKEIESFRDCDKHEQNSI